MLAIILPALLAQSGDAKLIEALSMTDEAIKSYYAGSYDVAKGLLAKAILAKSDCFEAHFWMGRVYMVRAADPEQKQAAADSFSRCLEIRRSGEDAAIAAAWLGRVAGRSKRVLTVPYASRSVPNYDRYLTERMLQETIAQHPSKYMVGDLSRLETAPDELVADKYARLVVEEAGVAEYGYIAFVSCGYEGNRGGGDHSSTAGTVMLFDPLTGRFLPESTFGSAEKFWELVRASAKPVIDLKAMDHVYVPTKQPGAYARSTADYTAAIKLPLIAVHEPISAAEHSGVAADVIARFADQIAADRRYAVVTASQLASLAVRLGRSPEEAARLVGAKFLVKSNLTRFTATVKDELLQRLARTNIDVELELVDLAASSTSKHKANGFASRRQMLHWSIARQAQESYEEAVSNLLRSAAKALPKA